MFQFSIAIWKMFPFFPWEIANISEEIMRSSWANVGKNYAESSRKKNALTVALNSLNALKSTRGDIRHFYEFLPWILWKMFYSWHFFLCMKSRPTELINVLQKSNARRSMQIIMKLGCRDGLYFIYLGNFQFSNENFLPKSVQ